MSRQKANVINIQNIREAIWNKTCNCVLITHIFLPLVPDTQMNATIRKEDSISTKGRKGEKERELPGSNKL